MNTDKIFIEYCKSENFCEASKLNVQSATINNSFYECCIDGHLNSAKWLLNYDKDSIDIEGTIENIFRYCCAYGHLEVVRWIKTHVYNNIDIHMYDDEPFRWSCINGKLDVAQWLYSLDHIEKRTIDSAFKSACQKNIFDIAKWLSELYQDYLLEFDNSHNIINWSVCKIVHNNNSYSNSDDDFLIIDADKSSSNETIYTITSCKQ